MGTFKAAEATKIIQNYGIRESGAADLVVFEAKNPEEAILKQARPLHVVKNGNLVVENGMLKI